MNAPASDALERALSTGESEFHEISDFAPVMIWRAGVDKLCDWFNKPWLDFVGRTLEQAVGYGWADGVHSEDYDRCVATYSQSFDARRPFSMEYRVRRHDGEYRWLVDNGTPFYRDGDFSGYFGSCIDITAYKLIQQNQQALIHELDHRVNNTLSIVQALARQTFKPGAIASASCDAFDGRLAALATVHEVLTGQNWRDASLRQVVESLTLACCPEAERISIAGPDVHLTPKKSVSLALALHELYVNAVKYGALSETSGRVSVRWNLLPGSGQLHLSWREEGGPSVAQPQYRGFGTQMLTRALPAEFAGTVLLDFAPSGVVCSVTIPFDAEYDA